MPFDNVMLETYDKPRDDIRLVRRRQLIAALRAQPEKGPAIVNGTEFLWDFAFTLEKSDVSCGYVGCAIGMAKLLWPELRFTQGWASPEIGCEWLAWTACELGNVIGLSKIQTISIFLGLNLTIHAGNITPQMIAAELEYLGDYLANEEET